MGRRPEDSGRKLHAGLRTQSRRCPGRSPGARSHVELPPAAKSQLQLVNRNGLRLLRLVNTLLDFSRIEAGRIRALYRPTDLAAYTAELASIFRAAIERAGLRLIVDCPRLPVPVYVDRDMWEKIVLNLLSNAFKFTFEGEVRVCLQQVGNAAVLQVEDTGTGIPESEIPHLFERFHRVENARGRTHEGSGIGLALVQELVHMHRGRITAQSTIGRGTIFTVSVPLGFGHLRHDQIGKEDLIVSTGSRASSYVEEALRWLPDEASREGAIPELPVSPEAALYRGQTDDPDRPRARVLIADDNSDMRQYVTRLLAEQYDVEAVADGDAALAAIRERLPDLVITDGMMLNLDGFGLLRILRADARTAGLPVIMLSARAGEDSRVEGMEAGADDYLVKPFSAREMLARVRANVDMARVRRQANESLRESEERLRIALDTGRLGTWQLDLATLRLDCSAQCKAIFGVPADAPLSYERLWEVVHPYDRERVRQLLASAIAERADYDAEYRACWPDGSTRWVTTRGRGLYDEEGEPLRMIGVALDITERKVAEDTLRRYAEALTEADRRKDEFLATLAHELRNPLVPLRNGLEILRMAGDNPAGVEALRVMMKRQVDLMVRLIDDLLDLSRISRGKIELRRKPMQLADVLRQAVEIGRAAIEEAGHRFSVEVPPDPILVNADAARLAQVFANLLNNAAKFTENGRQIALTVEPALDEVFVTVRDNGIGIPANMLDKIFDMFIQVDRSLERSQGGLGIGLSLVRELVQLHGGSVQAKSDGDGRGSEFVVRLPIACLAHEVPPVSVPKRVAMTGRRRILVVDDNRDAATSLAMMLEFMGNETRSSYDGLEALDTAEEFRPDIILLDIGMPKMNGHEACRRIRRQTWGKDVVLVAITGWGQEDDRRRSREAGFDFHVVKPVESAALEELLSTVDESIAHLRGTLS
jgi:PAS domain S-box-containing protein